MIWLIIGVGVLALAQISILATARLRRTDNPAWTALSQQRKRVEAELIQFVAERKDKLPQNCAPTCDHPKSPEIWNALVARKPEQALTIAEEAMAMEHANPDARLLLALALLAHGDLDAAAVQLNTAKELGARTVLADYLCGRVELAQYLHSIAGASQGSQNAIVMPIELLALELHVRLGDAGDATALWLPGHEGGVSRQEARDFVVTHFTGYYRLVDTMLKSLRSDAYADGLYLLARLAFKCGFSELGAALLVPLEPVMKNSAVHSDYRRDLALLRGERTVTGEAIGEGGRKVIKLKVLN